MYPIIPTGRGRSYTMRLLILLVVTVFAACDGSEDPYLLNPPLPDSSRVRIVNLLDNEPIDASIFGYPIATNLSPRSSSPYTSLLIQEQTSLVVSRTAKGDIDTVPNQILARGSRITYLILPRGDTATQFVSLAVGKLDQTDLLARNSGLIGFVNAVDDTTVLLIKSGCQSGDTIVPGLTFARSTGFETEQSEMSIYLFVGNNQSPVTSARISTAAGTISHLIAARTPSGIKLFSLTSSGSEPGGALVEAPQESRTTARVSLLNALFDDVAVSARLESGGVVATGLTPRSISPPVDIEACSSPSGDRMIVSSPNGDTTSAFVRLSVGGNAVVVVYDRLSEIKSLVLNRTATPPAPGTIKVRCANLSRLAGTVSVSTGAGSPDSVAVEGRPFGSLGLGGVSGYATLKVGTYPFMLTSATDGSYLSGGRTLLTSGTWTLLVVDRLGTPTMFLLDDNDASRGLIPLDKEGVRGTFLNVIPDARVTFTVDGLSLPALAYGYVARSVIPFATPSVGSDVGSAVIDPSLGGHTICATSAGGTRSVIAFATATNPPIAGHGQIRFLNLAEPGVDLQVREGSAATPVIGTVSFGFPSQTVDTDIRKYSFVVTRADSSEILAQTDGVEFTPGRRYLMVIAPKRAGSLLPTLYSIVWVQE